MTLRCLGFVAAALLLSGCTTSDWDNAMTYVGVGQKSDDTAYPSAPVAAAEAPVAVAPAIAGPSASEDSFCKGVARSDAYTAAGNGMGAAEQGRIAEDSYRQCVAKAEHRLD